MFTSGKFRLFSLFASLLVVFSMVTIDTAEARRMGGGLGGFGNRGVRTTESVPATRTSPTTTAPVQRTTAEPSTSNRAASATPAAGQRAPGLFSGGLMRGLFIGGLFGLLMGAGFGGIGGLLSLLFQVVLIGGLVWLALAFFGRRKLAAAGGPKPAQGFKFEAPRAPNAGATGFGGKPFSGFGLGGGSAASRPSTSVYEVSDADLALFEGRLSAVQDAFSHADRQRLAALTTPEVLGFLSEELEENAANGVRNEVYDVKLLDGSVAEAWTEGNVDYATVALRYESRDVMRNVASGAIVSGSEELSATTEIWTFRRERGGEWLLSAVQEP
ncbi:Predicted lipid-binding transport protein, Tim44 family [Devosia enhydra]|uniref:Predicted lipid-binding transport protein, Tim44 family n=1 Tax=Devosia enhydra TaxID=665118 RepID=A0A1K2HT06_9HYPH|nr:TIM44-like domain-containing protein [Devosia enhydra]SFZ81169.1 Predicted lipid-binding transport protein, Tim44 family [Devosia enhydra]